MTEAEICMFLNLTEAVRSIKILHAVEGGSRAWGFPSPNSDYDIRFIYARPVEHYLSYNVDSKRDVIEITSEVMPDLDAVGWDIRKVCHLFAKSNCALLEHLHSSIVYRNPVPAIERLQKQSRNFNPTALCFHYYQMAKNNAKEFLIGKDEVSYKKYLYVLRGFIAVDFIREFEILPPVNFEYLLEATSEVNMNVLRIYDAVHGLIHNKRTMEEMGTGRPNKLLDIYIENALNWNEQVFVDAWVDRACRSKVTMRADLDDVFREAIGYESKSTSEESEDTA